ncbi:MAG: sigma-70 family RNA polymerase sigma factor [Patescibacteria group bacterium]
MSDDVLRRTWKEYYPKVYGYFFRRITNKTDVEDLTSIVMTKFLNLFQDENKLNKIKNRHAYLWKIAHNQLVYFIKTQQKKAIEIGFGDDYFEIDNQIEHAYSTRYQHKIQCLLECIDQSLKDQDAQIVKMAFIEEKSSKSIGHIFELKPENVRQKISRSIKKLKLACRDIWQECKHN